MHAHYDDCNTFVLWDLVLKVWQQQQQGHSSRAWGASWPAAPILLTCQPSICGGGMSNIALLQQAAVQRQAWHACGMSSSLMVILSLSLCLHAFPCGIDKKAHMLAHA